MFQKTFCALQLGANENCWKDLYEVPSLQKRKSKRKAHDRRRHDPQKKAALGSHQDTDAGDTGGETAQSFDVCCLSEDPDRVGLRDELSCFPEPTVVSAEK
jgi:hypothetical protein